MTDTKQIAGTTNKKSRRGRIAVSIGENRPEQALRVASPRPATKPLAKASVKATTRSRISALDAAAKILGGLSTTDAAAGLEVKDLIGHMARTRLWKSPGGKTPCATLYSALIREIKARGSESRFRRVSPGKFTLAANANKKRYSNNSESKR
ncbi:MAG: hypothetical protein JSR52_00800 [Planctomycetes bacterium]|nr:hypothetical protein [Planctomycetota bacterium]